MKVLMGIEVLDACYMAELVNEEGRKGIRFFVSDSCM
jgi:hypothetical protein